MAINQVEIVVLFSCYFVLFLKGGVKEAVFILEDLRDAKAT